MAIDVIAHTNRPNFYSVYCGVNASYIGTDYIQYVYSRMYTPYYPYSFQKQHSQYSVLRRSRINSPLICLTLCGLPHTFGGPKMELTAVARLVIPPYQGMDLWGPKWRCMCHPGFGVFSEWQGTDPVSVTIVRM